MDSDLTRGGEAGTNNPVFRLGASFASASAMAERRARWVRLMRAAVALTLVVGVGTWGYWYLSSGEHTIVQALYMTVISVSTVGFNEVIPIETDTMRLFTIGLILFGGASVLYFLTAIAAFVVEGDFLYGFWRRRLRAQVSRARDHVIVVGLGRVGGHAFGEILRSGLTVVGVDREPARVERLVTMHGLRILFMVGDGADEALLRGAGITEARTLVSALADDRDNFLVCVTARQLNPDIRLIVRLVSPDHAAMFDELDAEAVVHPPALSGMRLAQEILHPELTAFTDRMLEGDGLRRALMEIVIPEGSPLIDLRIGDLSPRAHDAALVLGVRPANAARDAPFPFGPSVQHRLGAGDTVLVLGSRRDRRRLARIAHRPDIGLLPGSDEPGIKPVLRSKGARPAAASEPHAHSHDHVVVIGAGAVGRAAVAEILRHDIGVTVVDREPEHLALIDDSEAGERNLLRRVVGDVAGPGVLDDADLAHARGFITALQELRDNLFLAASVRMTNPHTRVVSRVGNEAQARRLRAVGAAVVNPGHIGGTDIAHRTVRPDLVEFTRGLEASWDHLEQLALVTISHLPGNARTLGDLDLSARTGCLVLGYRRGHSGAFAYHPPPSLRVRLGATLVALGEPHQITRLRDLVGS